MRKNNRSKTFVKSKSTQIFVCKAEERLKEIKISPFQHSLTTLI